jgi:hypothetical protein
MYGSDISIFDGYSDTAYSVPEITTDYSTSGIDVAQAIADANAAVGPVPYVPYGGGTAGAPVSSTASSSFLDQFKTIGSDVIDFGKTVINMRSNADQLKLQNAAVQNQTVKTTQQANVQKAQADAIYNRDLQAAQNSTLTTMLIPAILIGAFLLLKHK